MIQFELPTQAQVDQWISDAEGATHTELLELIQVHLSPLITEAFLDNDEVTYQYYMKHRNICEDAINRLGS